MPLHPIDAADLPAVVDLVNLAYRGAGEAWNTETGYIDGDRMTLAMLRADLADQPDALFLVWRDGPGSPIVGCVWLEPAEPGVWYVGTVTVHPEMQDRRLGRAILAAAEAEARVRGARRMRMTVVNVRTTLIGWYERRGYALTGQSLPFPYEDARFGNPLRDDLAFLVLERPLE